METLPTNDLATSSTPQSQPFTMRPEPSSEDCSNWDFLKKLVEEQDLHNLPELEIKNLLEVTTPAPETFGLRYLNDPMVDPWWATPLSTKFHPAIVSKLIQSQSKVSESPITKPSESAPAKTHEQRRKKSNHQLEK